MGWLEPRLECPYGSTGQLGTDGCAVEGCFYYTLEPICQAIEVIMTKGLLTELSEPSKQIKVMKHFMLPNRQAAVPPESHSAGQTGSWRGESNI